jgi:hypothetical protein
MEDPMSPVDDRTGHHHDEPRARLAPRRDRPGWFWLGCIAFGIACWIGLGFGARSLLGFFP